MSEQKFKLGDSVKWGSQAQGRFLVKSGVVAEVVRAGMLPDRERFKALHRCSGVGSPRKHESYVVMVGKKPYWPRVSGIFIDQAARA